MKVVVQNVQKRAGLASRLLCEHEPDVLLVQEVNQTTEQKNNNPNYHEVHHTSRLGYGTAIYGKEAMTNVKLINSPHAEFGGFIVKKTTIACCRCNGAGEPVQFVSFHGYNGQPMKLISNLVDHVEIVLQDISSDVMPTIFAGDFNTWTQDHVDAVTTSMGNSGFSLVCSWPYPGREVPLDHAFVRGLKLETYSTYKNGSDHLGAVLVLSPKD